MTRTSVGAEQEQGLAAEETQTQGACSEVVAALAAGVPGQTREKTTVPVQISPKM